eukprot:CAMPEP_0194422768 /NCGR_PEP_ID=MMETSP0176-20130528/22081_1 /TAXON_ID=216777 /ORGANISM="Proboscia alata, Strain PI-D3" /LENGTH=356 /DNA_ID=CAMNT_0039231687 /DNA_START=112 /DNA_END=1179 /DNA_ORIENTATION=+
MSYKVNRKTIIITAIPALISIYLRIAFRTFDGAPQPDQILKGTLPIWRHPDLNVRNKIHEYMSTSKGFDRMMICSENGDVECRTNLREMLHKAEVDIYAKSKLVSAMMKSEVNAKRPNGNGSVKISMMSSKGLISAMNSNAPLILWMEGDFIFGHDGHLAHLMQAMKSDNEGFEVLQNAVWARVHTRLAPEHRYPAAPDDCTTALEYLLRPRHESGLGLGGGGLHIAGFSGGGTLAAITTLRALNAGREVASLFVESPILPTASGLKRWGEGSPFKSNSYYRNAYTRLNPIRYLNWSVNEYANIKSGGVTNVDEWRTAGKKMKLPPLVLLTEKVSPLHDAGVEFGAAYRDAAGEFT